MGRDDWRGASGVGGGYVDWPDTPAAHTSRCVSRSPRRSHVVVVAVAMLSVVVLAFVLTTCSRGAEETASFDGAADTPIEALEAAFDDEVALAEASTTLVALSLRDSSAGLDLGDDGVLIVALDPGHGGEDPGAMTDALNEADINWTIAQYCAAYLQQYEGVEVVFTRLQSTNPSFENRALVAANANADIVVSLHINASEYAGEQGAYTYYPNETSTWMYERTVVPGKLVAASVLDYLVDLGLKDNGSWAYTLTMRDLRDAADPSSYFYPNDETGVSDYYAIIRWPRQYGIPAVLVEHAFITNPSDSQLLYMESFLKALGEADAKGILAVYGFSLV